MKGEVILFSAVLIIGALIVSALNSAIQTTEPYALNIADISIHNTKLLSLIDTGKTVVAINIKNIGSNELRFVKCEFSIHKEGEDNPLYEGSIDVIDKLEPRQSMTRESKEIKQDLTNDNDGKNFYITGYCYSEETREQNQVSSFYKEFT